MPKCESERASGGEVTPSFGLGWREVGVEEYSRSLFRLAFNKEKRLYPFLIAERAYCERRAIFSILSLM
jgi:hypothetical protein